MPPGFPFKVFELMAGVTEMRYLHFLLSIFVGRLLRFLTLGILIIAYGPEIVSFLAGAFRHHRIATLAVIGGIILLTVLVFHLRNSRAARQGKTQEEPVA
jgi:membrane protein DedA with SNARE-associated domain